MQYTYNLLLQDALVPIFYLNPMLAIHENKQGFHWHGSQQIIIAAQWTPFQLPSSLFHAKSYHRQSLFSAYH